MDLTDDAVNAGAVAWVLTSTALVFLMTAGLGFFYGGLVRDTNIINTMMMSVISMGIVCFSWVVLGFSWAFGENSTSLGPWIGSFDYSLWMNLDMKMWGDLPGLCFASFQMTFAPWSQLKALARHWDAPLPGSGWFGGSRAGVVHITVHFRLSKLLRTCTTPVGSDLHCA